MQQKIASQCLSYCLSLTALRETCVPDFQRHWERVSSGLWKSRRSPAVCGDRAMKRRQLSDLLQSHLVVHMYLTTHNKTRMNIQFLLPKAIHQQSFTIRFFFCGETSVIIYSHVVRKSSFFIPGEHKRGYFEEWLCCWRLPCNEVDNDWYIVKLQ